MITSLTLKNFALIDHAHVIFQKGLNIITGESGAGKSILVNALSQLCGERSNLDFIKSGEKKAIIEAEFDLTDRKDVLHLLENHSFEIENDTLIIRKEISQSGASRIFINDTPVQLSVLNKISVYLIDLHGQHQHQALLHPENHLNYLDAFAGLQNSVKDFTQLVKKYDALENKLNDLEKERSNALQMTDLYQFQLQELKSAAIEEGELERLKEELKVLSNFEKLHSSAEGLSEVLSSGESNAAYLVTKGIRNLNELAEIDPQFIELLDNLNMARETIEEVSQFTERYLGNLEFDPERVEQIRQRIAQIEFLLKKYQKIDSDGLLELISELNQKLAQINNYDDFFETLQNEQSTLEKIILDNGMALSLKRKQSAREFENLLSSFLKEIGMDNSRFEFHQEFKRNSKSSFKIDDTAVKLNNDGFDDILIQFSPNPGESLKPINKIASGGELSRVMLALKSVLAEKDRKPLLVFDEIDSGISGKVAQIVGKKINELSRYHQIICITHLPQIAAFADYHYKVEKSISEHATHVEIEPLVFEEQVKEIANLLAGVNITKEAIDNASQLLSESRKIK